MEQRNVFDVLSDGSGDPNIDAELKRQLFRLPELSLPEVFDVKSKLEAQLSQLFDNLQRQGTDLESSLVTEDGFPRSDIDVLQARLIRRSINMLRNDLKAVIVRTQELMADQFQKLAAKTQLIDEREVLEYRIPFAAVTEVVFDSPSHSAGLSKDDKIVRFGNLHAGNNKSLSAIGPLVQGNEEKPVTIRVLRNGVFLNLTLVPSRKWAGPGLLGCRLVHI
ncbi:LAQU0S04e04654g1_1 [Lachancea quebecensis]|uniref:Probable 26S proteasome regulatory subunit p27 n=1 Tax=Lachancea quebecensis TaxID=1654605 RepID=A0A0P1KSI6_9SACH|nr:LAQU0S04e04654g1_1 [Lachancea quebecensis]